VRLVDEDCDMSPFAPKRPCPGQCGRLITRDEKRCAPCLQAWNRQYDAGRKDDEFHRFYMSSAWRKARAAFIAEHPVCAAEDCGAPSAHVDHIVPLRERPDLAMVPGNWRALCVRHHSSRSAASGQRWGRR
jgi:5-methylcytosine-specific restriction protein A